MARARGGGAGYAAAVVIFGAGFVICLLLAIVFYAQLGTAREGAQKAHAKLLSYANERQQESVAKLESGKGTVVGQLQGQNQQLSGKVNQLQTKNQQLDAKVTALKAQLDAAKQARQKARQEAAKARSQSNQLSNTFDKKVKGLAGQVGQVSQVASSFGTLLNNVKSTVEQRMSKQTQAHRAQVRKLQTKLADAQQKLQKTQHQLDDLRNKFTRSGNPTKNITQPDAKIVSKISSNQVTLNIGRNQQTLLGMSFEIFSPDQNIKLDKYNNLRGKATVEIFQLQPNSATARVVRRTHNADIHTGDLAVNLVYSPHGSYKFYVYGKFDINGSGNATARDRERIDNLITRWGGSVTDDLSYDDDFLVLGEEPTAPKPLPEGTVDPAKIQAHEAARKDYQTYQNLVAKAKDLGIPVLNQHRFLALVGYFQRS